ncbi:complement C1q tumor necrosis factor-related protein 3-like [Engraulis encrasicolus]|uniref:complement C1q tumor necrosis factor-related protein 3-like n=1 Tax=Engraulis encrasicolus TaxID=184585 RepID=UPI002FD61694
MRAAISLLVLLFSMCGVQCGELDVSAELKELRDMVVELRGTLKYTQNEVKVLEAENAAAKTKVAFSVGLGKGFTQAGSDHMNLVFSRVITNVGEAYSSETGFFTAPVSGVYYFRFTVRDDPYSSAMHIMLNKNGERLVWLWDYDTDGRPNYLSSGLTVQLEQGDAVNMMIPAGYRLWDDADGNESTFSGFLLFRL